MKKHRNVLILILLRVLLKARWALHAVYSSCVQLCASPWTLAPRLLCPWDFGVRILEWVAVSFNKEQDISVSVGRGQRNEK